MSKRMIHTCFGEFIIEADIACSVMDVDLYYHLPTPSMTDDEIKDYFEMLKETEE